MVFISFSCSMANVRPDAMALVWAVSALGYRRRHSPDLAYGPVPLGAFLGNAAHHRISETDIVRYGANNQYCSDDASQRNHI